VTISVLVWSLVSLTEDFHAAVAASESGLPGPELLPQRLATACAQVLPVDGAGVSLAFMHRELRGVGALDLYVVPPNDITSVRLTDALEVAHEVVRAVDDNSPPPSSPSTRPTTDTRHLGSSRPDRRAALRPRHRQIATTGSAAMASRCGAGRRVAVTSTHAPAAQVSTPEIASHHGCASNGPIA
jgi:hypothetical protein